MKVIDFLRNKVNGLRIKSIFVAVKKKHNGAA